jgi:small-conductance mechanosensitive channel
MLKYITIIIFIISSLVASAQRADTSLDSAVAIKDSVEMVPVVVYKDTLFYLQNGLGSKSITERAEDITRKSENVINDFNFDAKLLKIDSTEFTTFIKYDEEIIVAVGPEDEISFGKPRMEIAKQWLGLLGSKIELENKDRSYKSILINVGITILILIAFFIFIKYVNKLFRFFTLQLHSLKDVVIKDIKLKQVKLLDSNNLLHFAIIALRGVKIAFILFCLYFVFPIIFSLFPWTQGLSEKLYGYVLDPLKGIVLSFINYIPNLITIIIIFVVARQVVKFLHFIADEIQKERLTLPNFYPEWAKPTFNIARFLIYTFVVIITYKYLPYSDINIFQGVSIFIGVLVSLGSSTAIANIVSGLIITYMRPFQIGDKVKIDNIMGIVTQKTLLVTRLRTAHNEDITVPNSKILSSHTTNYTSSSNDLGLILNTTVTIGYDVPHKTVSALLIAAAKNSDGIDKDKEPFVLQTALEDFYVAYQLNAYTSEPHRMASIYSEMHRNIQDQFFEAGVEILSPHYRAARDGNHVAIPDEYLPKDYTAPGFNINNNEK